MPAMSWPWGRRARLYLGRNDLRRPSDRFEGAVLGTLAALFGAVVVVAVLLAGHVDQVQHAEAARLRPAVAVLSDGSVLAGSPFSPVAQVQAQATWWLVNGTERAGLLTSRTAPAVNGAPAGASVPIWLNRQGDPQPPPPGQVDIVANAIGAGVTFAAGMALLLAGCYWLSRRALDRHRLAGWGQAWADTGPQWSSRP
jgi:hypothetical protein